MHNNELGLQRHMDMLSSALGKEILSLMEDKDVTEIILNPDCKIWVDRLSSGKSCTGIKMDPYDSKRFIQLVASYRDEECHSENPLISAEIPGSGYRFQGWLPPVVLNPAFNIRIPSIQVFTLDDYVKQKIMTETQKDRIKKAVKDKENIIICGGTRSGKTTFLNAILDDVANYDDRVVIIEDTLEAQCKAKDCLILRSNGVVSANDLLRSSMRASPDRIVFGEARDAAAWTLLKAWTTGHRGGCCSIHTDADKKKDAALLRLEQLVLESKDISTPQERLIAQAVDLIVYIQKIGLVRKITGIVEVKGFKNQEYILNVVEGDFDE